MPTLKPYKYITEDTTAVNNKHIILLVDASGSMSSYVDETRQSIDNIIKDLDENTHLTLVYFDSGEYQIVVDCLVKDIDVIAAKRYTARGGTPITDSMYKAIQDVTKDLELEQLCENHKVICFTDGEENSSTYVKTEDLGRAVEHMTENFKWDFQFLGPKSQERGIKQYTDSIKIKQENVKLYADVSEGLKQMTELAVA